jgi:uncharacterized protein YuzE
MLFEFDPEADVLFIRLRDDKPHTTGTRIDERRIVHVDDAGDPVAIELLFVSAGVLLDGLPQAAAIAEALRGFPQVAA